MSPSEPTRTMARAARDALIQAIRAHAPRDEQLRLADVIASTCCVFSASIRLR